MENSRVQGWKLACLVPGAGLEPAQTFRSEGILNYQILIVNNIATTKGIYLLVLASCVLIGKVQLHAKLQNGYIEFANRA